MGFTQCFQGEKKFIFLSVTKNGLQIPGTFPIWKQNFELRRDQRAFLLHLTGGCSAKSPHNPAGFVPQKARPS